MDVVLRIQIKNLASHRRRHSLRLAGQSYPSITGTLQIASENPYCPSCQGVIQQFHDMFPNLNLILVDGIK